jgi:hypothetical protein|nr:MAG TPA: hypothetical protein [Caudoviricetes sp.]
MGIEDIYTAFCFNEACAEIMLRLQNEEKPIYREQREEEQEEYSNFTEFYKKFGGK